MSDKQQKRSFDNNLFFQKLPVVFLNMKCFIDN